MQSLIKQAIKRSVGESGVLKTKKAIDHLVVSWLRIVCRSVVLTRLHYALLSSAFDREAKAVIAGHIEFATNQLSVEPVNYFLRRSIHRLEKGLIMEPRRDVFALDYIEQTVEAYGNALQRDDNTQEVAWAHDVLTEYFEVTSEQPTIRVARERFRELNRKFGAKSIEAPAAPARRIPFRYNDSMPGAAGYDSLLALAKRRASVRWYDQRVVSRDLIDRAIQVALQAPSACNRQPYKFMVFDDEKSVSRVAKLPGGAAGFEHNFPVIVALVGRLRAYPHYRDRHVIYIDSSLGAMSFMYALEAQGIASCAINWPDVKKKEEEAAELLGLSADERLIMFISLGYAKKGGLIPFSEKRSVTDSRVYNPRLTER